MRRVVIVGIIIVNFSKNNWFLGNVKEALKYCRREKNRVGGKVLGGLIKWVVEYMR